MAVTHSTATRNALADEVDARVNTGSTDAGGDLVIMDGAVDLIEFNLQDPAYGAASSGTITLAGTPISATAAATGTADKYEVRNKDNAMVHTGTVTGDGGGGDIEIDNPSVASSQDADLESHSYSAAA